VKPNTSEYKVLHHKINKLFGKPTTCEQCNKTNLNGRSISWANLSGEYKVERADWKRLCRFCHMTLDIDHYDGKRFTGHKHSEKAKLKQSEASKKMWEERREFMMSVQPRGEHSARYIDGRSYRHVSPSQ
jgi:hypothetical protein